jgi:ATP-dependent DNA helicase RecG
LLKREVEEGRQGYVVYPLVEESEKVDLQAATEMARFLEEKIYPEYRIGLLHGKMKPEEKERIMAEFKDNRIQILVSTTVIEVGVDVANASVMIIEHAERFGLAQLHQLRGRVGRGPRKSYCLLIADGFTPEARRRIEAMVRTSDGFKIAEVDLDIRGPGEFLGTRQSGLPELRAAHLVRDVKILQKARADAFDLVEKDPYLSKSEHAALRRELGKRWKGRLRLGGV